MVIVITNCSCQNFLRCILFNYKAIQISFYIPWEIIKTNIKGSFFGFGAFIGGVTSGWVVDLFTADGVKDWRSIWFVFAGYALLLGIIFPFVFKYKHERKVIKMVQGEVASDKTTFRP